MNKNMIDQYISFVSQLFHILSYSVRRPKLQFETGMIIISIDVDVGSRQLGIINRHKNDSNVNKQLSEYRIGEIEEMSLPLLLETFNDFGVPVTFAVRGQLTEVDDSTLGLLLKSPVRHDIGAHGYYHRKFAYLSHREAERELKMISQGMKKFGITPQSFVFPAGSVAHLDLLERHGYKCYRDYGDFLSDSMTIEQHGKLYNIRPSLCIDRNTKFIFLKQILDISIERKLPFHVWFHLWGLGQDSGSIRHSVNNIFFPLLDYARGKKETGVLTFETMVSATEKVRCILPTLSNCNSLL